MDSIDLDGAKGRNFRTSYYTNPGEGTLTLPLFSRVILTQDIPGQNLVVGDMGTVVEHHPATKDYPEGYEVECFAGNGETIAVVSVPESGLRAATNRDVMHVRQLTANSS